MSTSNELITVEPFTRRCLSKRCVKLRRGLRGLRGGQILVGRVGKCAAQICASLWMSLQQLRQGRFNGLTKGPLKSRSHGHLTSQSTLECEPNVVSKVSKLIAYQGSMTKALGPKEHALRLQQLAAQNPGQCTTSTYQRLPPCPKAFKLLQTF